MAIDDSPGTVPGSRVHWRNLCGQALVGFSFGYVVLHPASMAIFRWLDPRVATSTPHEMEGDFFALIAHSYGLAHLPMAIAFGMMGALVATFYAYHRLALTFQRDRLAEELRRNELLRAESARQAERLSQKNEELARLELANRRTTQFMAHDFKTALNCIGGFSDELLENPTVLEDPVVADALTCIRRQAHRMMGSVSDLLQLARVRERGNPPRELISVGELLHEAVSDFSLPAHAKQISLSPRHVECPPVLANPQLLHRVLCNLIFNAIKHNGAQTRVWLDACVGPSGRDVIFSCRDDGAGIPPDVLPSIFDEFTTTSDCTEGSTGLGLSFCKAAVEAHGGRIWCENLPQGALFCFTIPLPKDARP